MMTREKKVIGPERSRERRELSIEKRQAIAEASDRIFNTTGYDTSLGVMQTAALFDMAEAVDGLKDLQTNMTNEQSVRFEAFAEYAGRRTLEAAQYAPIVREAIMGSVDTPIDESTYMAQLQKVEGNNKRGDLEGRELEMFIEPRHDMAHAIAALLLSDGENVVSVLLNEDQTDPVMHPTVEVLQEEMLANIYGAFNLNSWPLFRFFKNKDSRNFVAGEMSEIFTESRFPLHLRSKVADLIDSLYIDVRETRWGEPKEQYATFEEALVSFEQVLMTQLILANIAEMVRNETDRKPREDVTLDQVLTMEQALLDTYAQMSTQRDPRYIDLARRWWESGYKKGFLFQEFIIMAEPIVTATMETDEYKQKERNPNRFQAPVRHQF